MYTLHVRLLARQDIQEIVDYYDLKASHVTIVFLEILFKELEIIQETPELFERKYRKTRVRYLQGFPFGVHYIIRENTVEVLAVLHSSRDPKNWNDR